jgi:threonine aldolase
LTDREFKRVFGPEVEAQYVFTGTAANVLSLAGLVRSFGAVIASDIAHLNVDECGAPEKFLGCKIWTIPTEDGRIFPDQALAFLERMGDQHYSQSRVVSLTQPTEFGTCYSLEELRAWRKFGGTKNGLMGAEAVLLFTVAAKESFKFYRKQAMQLSSKTRFLAAQFYAYFRADLHLEIANHVTQSAKALAEALNEFPEIKVAFKVESNAVFVQLPKAWISPLRDKFFFYVWDADKNLCRWMISFDWNAESQAHVLNSIREVKKCFPVK